MKHVLKNIIMLLLAATSLSALYGGMNLILQPDGSSLKLTPDWLIDSPFRDFMVPGLVLLLFIGVSGSVILFLFWKNAVKNTYLVILQGAILYGYIMIQIVMINTFVMLHAIFGGIGIVLVFAGWLFKRSS